MSCDKIHPLIGPYRDGELSAIERRAVAEHVKTCGACAGLLEADAELAHHVGEGCAMNFNQGLQAKITAALDNEDRRALGVANRLAEGARFDRAGFWSKAAAVILACAVSAGAGWQAAQTAGRSEELGRDVLQAHVRSLLQDNPVQVASSDSHTVKPWFAGRIEVAPNVRDLSVEGFPLVGGRLDYIGTTRVGVVVFKRNAHWVNVYMWPAAGQSDVGPTVIARNGYNMMSWTRGGVTSWAVSDVNTAELQRLQELL